MSIKISREKGIKIIMNLEKEETMIWQQKGKEGQWIQSRIERMLNEKEKEMREILTNNNYI